MSTTEAGLAKDSFGAIGIPVPSTAPFNDSSVEKPRGQGEQALHGFATDDFLWDVLSRAQAFKIRKKVDAVRAPGAGWLFFTIDLNDDSTAGPRWVDIKGKPHRDFQQADAGPIVGRHGPGRFENYRLRLNNVQIINNPSLYTTP